MLPSKKLAREAAGRGALFTLEPATGEDLALQLHSEAVGQRLGDLQVARNYQVLLLRVARSGLEIPRGDDVVQKGGEAPTPSPTSCSPSPGA